MEMEMANENPSNKPPENSSQNSIEKSQRQRKRNALTAATKLLGRYPRGAAEDPDEFVRAISGVLVDYEPEIIDYVIDRLPNECQWLPSVFEARQCAEARLRCLAEPALHARRVAEQLAERERLTDKSPEQRAKRQAFIADQRSRFPQAFSVQQNGKTEAQLAQEAKKWLVSLVGQEAFDKLPDQPTCFQKLPNIPR
jgi:hypothetical protein